VSPIKVIVNPQAGRGHGARLSPLIREALDDLAADYELVHTQGPRDAIGIAQRAIEDGFDTVVAVGGDGTSHEVVNGIMAHANGAAVGTLGFIPAGSGNDFAVMAGTPTDVRQACAQVIAGHTRLVDVGHLTIDGHIERFFDNAVGIGFDGLVVMETRRYRSLRGKALYVPVVLKTILSTMQPFHATITTEAGTFERTVAMAVACNGPREGGGFYVAPDARMDDGLLDLTLVDWMSRLRMFSMVPRFLKGTHVGDARVSIRRARRIELRSGDPLHLHVDGEIVSGPAHEVMIRVAPSALRVIAPASLGPPRL
jgi:diacylglycerol kinase (ATP)